MARTTRTLNPLHFEDLEPHRFEDLIRQLIYDFRNWRALEAIGRSGSDQGIDIRGIELDGINEANLEDEENGQEGTESWVREEEPEERVCVIQCKREKSIGPKKVRSIIIDFFSTAQERPYGYILTAACDFSKAARDAFREEMINQGVQEFHILGKAEIEDQLFLPKNDHLLFAYFNISLQVRRRSTKTLIRSRLSLERKLVKELGEINRDGHRIILIRDHQYEDYPYLKNIKAFIRKPLWRYWQFDSHQPPDHIAFVIRQHYAYVNWETKEWDILPDVDIAIPYHPVIFGLDSQSWDLNDKTSIYNAYWNRHVPEVNRAWATELGFIHYDRIVAFDDIGDSYNEGPHLLIDYTLTGGPFGQRVHQFLQSSRSYDRRAVLPEENLRTSFFPKEIPDEREEYRAELSKKIDESRTK